MHTVKMHRELDADSEFAFAMVAFAGPAPSELTRFMATHPAVGARISMDDAPAPRSRLSWLRSQLAACDVPPGAFAVISDLRSDDEINELRWFGNATVFQLGHMPPPGVTQPLPILIPEQPEAFYGCLQACVDPLAAFAPRAAV